MNNMRRYFLFALFCLLAQGKGLAQFAQCNRASDSLELVKFYNALHEKPWVKEWDFSKPLDSLFGVSLVAGGMGVRGIDLDGNLDVGVFGTGSGNGLQGTLPADLNLPCLEYLNLASDSVYGELPDFQFLPKLVQLLMRETDLTGSIPDFSALPNLEAIFVYANPLSGNLPTFQNCPKMGYIQLSLNSLTGSIPNYQLPNLGELQLAGNKLTGSLHDFSGTPKLNQMRLDGNQLSGMLPDFNLSEIWWLSLSANQFTGTIPDFSKMPELVHLLMHYNNFGGEVPPFSHCPKLKYFYASGCFDSLHANFPQAIQLSQISMPGTCLAGDVPNFANIAPNLNDVDFSNNYFTHLPNLTSSSLTKLNVEGNRLTFEDVLPNVPLGSEFRYKEQREIWNDTIIKVQKCAPLLLDLNIDDGISSNEYYWTLNNDSLTTTSNNWLFLPAVPQAGVFRCTVTNPSAPELTLETGSISVLLTGITECACPVVTLEVSASADTLCRGEQFSVSVENTQSGYYYSLLQNNQPVGNMQQGNGGVLTFPFPELDSSAVFKVKVIETALSGCFTFLVDSASVAVASVDTTFEVTPINIADDGIIAGCVNGSNPPFSVAFQPQAGNFSSLSDPDCFFSFEITSLPPGNYRLDLTDGRGCLWEKTIPVNLFIPRPDTPQDHPVVTPNGDGMNDVLIFFGLQAGEDAELVVLNRFGQPLFRERPYGQNWDATWLGKPLPNGAYPFSLTIFGANEQVVKGYVTILNE